MDDISSNVSYDISNDISHDISDDIDSNLENVYDMSVSEEPPEKVTHPPYSTSINAGGCCSRCVVCASVLSAMKITMLLVSAMAATMLVFTLMSYIIWPEAKIRYIAIALCAALIWAMCLSVSMHLILRCIRPSKSVSLLHQHSIKRIPFY